MDIIQWWIDRVRHSPDEFTLDHVLNEISMVARWAWDESSLYVLPPELPKPYCEYTGNEIGGADLGDDPEPGAKVRCLCGAMTTITKAGKLRKHRCA